MEFRICYDGTVEIYMPVLQNSEISGYELEGSYQLTADEIENLKKAIDQKLLYNLDPELDSGACDGENKILYLYDAYGNVLKQCGGYAPCNKDFNSMYKAVKNVFHLEEHSRLREEWMSRNKDAA